MEKEKKTGKIINLPRSWNINQRYGTYNWISNKTIWIELTGVVELVKGTTTTNKDYQFQIKPEIYKLIKKHNSYFNKKYILLVEFSIEQLENKNKSYYTLQLTLSIKENILFKDPEFQLEIKDLIDEINNYIQSEGTFLFLESKMR